MGLHEFHSNPASKGAFEAEPARKAHFRGAALEFEELWQDGFVFEVEGFVFPLGTTVLDVEHARLEGHPRARQLDCVVAFVVVRVDGKVLHVDQLQQLVRVQEDVAPVEATLLLLFINHVLVVGAQNRKPQQLLDACCDFELHFESCALRVATTWQQRAREDRTRSQKHFNTKYTHKIHTQNTHTNTQRTKESQAKPDCFRLAHRPEGGPRVRLLAQTNRPRVFGGLSVGELATWRFFDKVPAISFHIVSQSKEQQARLFQDSLPAPHTDFDLTRLDPAHGLVVSQHFAIQDMPCFLQIN